ncbi:MAG: phage tail tape measure protein, partial [Planctomycetota bacterium]
MSLERKAATLAQKAYGTAGTEGQTRKSLQRGIIEQARTLGVSTGLGTEGITTALDQFVAISGNLPTAQAMAPFMADIADATGADITDVGRTGGQVAQALIATKGLDPSNAEDAAKIISETESILAAMAGQAKVGSIEFAELATQMGKLISSTSRFEGETSQLTATMGAMAQLAIAGGASSAEEAMTSVKRFSDDLVQNSERWDKAQRAAGVSEGERVRFFTDESRTKLRDPAEILEEMLRATEPFIQTKDGDIDIEGAMRKLQGFRAQTMGSREIRESAAFQRQTTSKRFEIAVAEFNNAVGSELMPVVADMIPVFTSMIPAVAEAAKWLGTFAKVLATDPLGTIFSLMAAKIGADIATAGIGEAIKMAMLKQVAIGSVPAGGGIGGAGRAAAGGAAAAGGLRGAAAAAVRGQTLAGAASAGMMGLGLGALAYGGIDLAGKTAFQASESRTDKALQQQRYIEEHGTAEERTKFLREMQARKLASDQGMSRMAAKGIDAIARPAWMLAAPSRMLMGQEFDLKDFASGGYAQQAEDFLFGTERRTLAGMQP